MEELDLKELFNIFWNKKVHIILIVLIFIALGIIYTVGFTTPMYQSTITLILAGEETEENIPNKITTTDITLNSKLVATYKTLIKNQDILQEVISNLDINISWENLKNSISVTAEENTGVLEVIVKTADPKNSAEVANELAKVFIEKVSEIYKSTKRCNNVCLCWFSNCSNICFNFKYARYDNKKSRRYRKRI